jgi:CRP-like cAMP-binding protein
VGVSADRLAGLPLFSALSPDELAAVCRCMIERQCDAGTRLATEGAPGYTFFVIEKGDVEVAQDGHVINTLGPGDFFGEMAIVSGDRRSATVTATSAVDLLVLFGTEFRVLERDLTSVAAKITATLAERARPAARAS